MDFAQILIAIAAWCSLNAGTEKLISESLTDLRKDKMTCQKGILTCLNNSLLNVEKCFKESK